MVATDELSPGDAILEELYRSHHRSLVRLAYLVLGGAEVSEEVVQDAYVRVLAAFRAQRPRDHAAYLRTAVLNAARSRARASRFHLPGKPETPLLSPEEEATLAETDRMIMRAIRSLPMRQKECLILHYYEDMTEGQIAEVRGVTVGSVRKHLHRARAALAQRLGEKGRP